MNKLTILTLAITVLLYRKAQCCNSTYNTSDIKYQYNNNITCANEECVMAVGRFANTANSIITEKELSPIINQETFKVSPNVSLHVIEVNMILILNFTDIRSSTRLYP